MYDIERWPSDSSDQLPSDTDDFVDDADVAFEATLGAAFNGE